MVEAAGKIIAVCISPERGMRKIPVEQAEMVRDYGIRGDAHAGASHRQVSLLSTESIEQIRRRGLDTFPGIFGENLVIEEIPDPLPCDHAWVFQVNIGNRERVSEESLRTLSKMVH